MNARARLRARLCLCLIAAGTLIDARVEATSSLAGRRPNIVVVLTDDQGYGDISSHGNPVLQTPHLDRMREQSARFTDFHVSPTCAPTRCALMTGRHEFYSGVTHTLDERERMALSATTLPQALTRAGYHTGIFGKWHLGDEDAYQPDQRGFQEVFIHGGGGIGQKYLCSCGDAPGNSYFNPWILHNRKFVKTDGYCTDVFFSNAMEWMARVSRDQPLFAWISTNAPHAPLHVRAEDEARYRDKVKSPEQAKFFGMIANIDDNVGRLLAQLQRLGIERNTLVIFMNDNGGTVGTSVYNAGMRGAKGTPWIGGTRAASFWRWPGAIEPRDIAELTAHIDLFPTLLELAGGARQGAIATQIHGQSKLSALEGTSGTEPERILFTHLGRWPRGKASQAKYRQCSVRTKRWHLVNTDPKGEKAWELFDVQADPGEKTNLAASERDVVARLDRAYDDWWSAILPALVNEDVPPRDTNPFADRFKRQFPNGP